MKGEVKKEILEGFSKVSPEKSLSSKMRNSACELILSANNQLTNTRSGNTAETLVRMSANINTVSKHGCKVQIFVKFIGLTMFLRKESLSVRVNGTVTNPCIIIIVVYFCFPPVWSRS